MIIRKKRKREGDQDSGCGDDFNFKILMSYSPISQNKSNADVESRSCSMLSYGPLVGRWRYSSAGSYVHSRAVHWAKDAAVRAHAVIMCLLYGFMERYFFFFFFLGRFWNEIGVTRQSTVTVY